MRPIKHTIVLVLMLVSQPLLATDCLRVVNSPSPPTVVLRGVICWQPSNSAPGAYRTVLKLATPICVQGTARDGLPFKKENVESIEVGVPANLIGALQPLDRVTLRGELWGPADNDEVLDSVIFAVKDVL